MRELKRGHKMFSKRSCLLAVSALTLFAMMGCTADPAKQKSEFVASAEKFMAAAKYSDAVIQYRNALKIEPNSSPLNSSLGDAYFRNGQLREAFLAYKKATEIDPSNVGAQISMSHFYLVTQQFEEAMQIASTILTKNPDNIEASLVLANGFAGKKDTPHAI